MKKLFTYILLAGFVIQSCSQLWVMASFYLNRDYIAENMCVNRFDAIPICKGQCYLEKELQKNEQKQEQHFPDLKQKEIQLFQPTFFAFQFTKTIFLQEENHPDTEPDFNASEYHFSVFHPPRIV